MSRSRLPYWSVRFMSAAMILRPAVHLGMATVVTWLLSATMTAQPPAAREHEVKAAYLYQFGKFVQWPARPQDSTFDICIAGVDPFGASLAALVEGETIDNRTIRIRRVTATAESRTCHILFVGGSVEPQVAGLLQTLATEPVLTVSDTPQFVSRGGMVQFVTLGGRVRFEINLRVAQSAGLTLSSELLRVASAVRQNP